jgi:hypothetical protein
MDAQPRELLAMARENWDRAHMARFYAFRMRTLDLALALHGFADEAYLQAGAFQLAVDKTMEA